MMKMASTTGSLAYEKACGSRRGAADSYVARVFENLK
jgi:hypothetical protein